MIRGAGWGLFLFFLFLCFVGCRERETLLDSQQKFESLDAGKEFSLQEVPESIHKLIINFYAPDCPPCEKEIPALKKFFEKYRNDSSVGFVAIGSSLKAVEQNPKPGKDPPLALAEIRRELQEFRNKFSLSYPQYLADSAALRAWRVTGFPETFLFVRTPNGLRLKRKIISEITLETITEAYGSGG